MQLDEQLSQALARYGRTRRRLARSIGGSLNGALSVGGKDMLNWIDRLERPNVTALAEAMELTRGGASKIAARLRGAGLIESYQLPENRKSVYYRLTEAGAHTLGQFARAFEALRKCEMAYISGLPEARKHAALLFLEGLTECLDQTSPDELGNEGGGGT